MKVLISNDGLHAHYYQRMAWANAFRSCGIDVAIWDVKKLPAFDVFDKFEPDIFLGQSYNLDEATIKCIYERPHLKVGLRAGDWGSHKEFVDQSKYNILFLSQKEKEILKKLKNETGKPDFVHIHYTPQAIEFTHDSFKSIGIKPISLMMCADTISYGNAKFDPELECDIGFVGGFWPYKGKVITPYLFPLLNPVGKYKVKIFGNQPWKVNQYCGMINDDKVKDLFISAKICPNLSEPHAQAFGFDVNERIFKILYAGGFCISDNVEGYKTTFEKSVVYADSPADFQEKIDFYLKNPLDRIKIATDGNKHVKQHHTGFHRVAQILKEFENNDLSEKLMQEYNKHLESEYAR
jgi:spore maturation protein CgeB